MYETIECLSRTSNEVIWLTVQLVHFSCLKIMVFYLFLFIYRSLYLYEGDTMAYAYDVCVHCILYTCIHTHTHMGWVMLIPFP